MKRLFYHSPPLIRRIALVLVLVSPVLMGSTSAQEAPPPSSSATLKQIKEAKDNIPLKIEATHKSIKPKEGILTLQGDVTVSYQDMTLYCDRALIFQKEKEVYVSGNVEVLGRGTKLLCSEAFYRWDEEKGLFKTVHFANMGNLPDFSLDGGIDARGYLSAEEVVKVGVGKYDAHKVSLSSCGHAHPHWEICSTSADYTVNEETGEGTVRSWNNVIWAGGVPVFYLPYLQHTNNNRGDFPWVKFRTGKSSVSGHYGLIRAGVPVSADTFSYVDLDIREDWGVAGGLGYKKENEKVRSEGTVYGTKESWRKEGKIHDDRWRIKFEHRQYLNEQWEIQAESNVQSDRNMLFDYFRSEANTTNDSKNAAAAIRNVQRSYLEVFTRVNGNEWETETEYLPEVRYHYIPRQLKWGGLFYTSESRAGYLRRHQSSDLNLPDRETGRLDSYHEINKPFTLFDIMPTRVYSGLRGTLYGEGDRDAESKARGQVSWGAVTTLRAFSIYDYNYAPLNINSIRHIIEPSLAIDSLEDPSTEPEKLIHFDEIDELDHNRVLTLGFDNLLQTKRTDEHGEDVVVTLVDWRLEQPFYLSHRARDIHNNGKAWGNFTHFLDITPTPYVRLYNEVEYSTDVGRVEKYSIRFDQYAKSSRWDYQIEQRYERDSHNHIAFGVNGHLTRTYSGGVLVRQDWDNRDHREYGISLTRKNHCWTINVAFEYNELTDETQLRFDFWPNFMSSKEAKRFSLW